MADGPACKPETFGCIHTWTLDLKKHCKWDSLLLLCHVFGFAIVIVFLLIQFAKGYKSLFDFDPRLLGGRAASFGCGADRWTW